MGWSAIIVDHHDHSQGEFSDRTDHWQFPRGRFPPTYICSDCNSADAAVKRKLKLPKTWSFSPDEIGMFAKMAPHSGRTVIDYDLAFWIFRKECKEF
jgi:hypothetical protein